MSDHEAIPRLLAESAFVRRLARGLVRDAHTADDLAQDAMLEALQRPPATAPDPRGWLATVVHRAMLRQRRSAARRRRRETATARPEVAPDCDRRMQRHQELVQHVQALAEPYRSAIVLRFFDDLPPRRIAQRLQVPVATVRSRLQRGLQLLRARLDAQHGTRDRWLSALSAIGWPSGGSAAVPVTLTFFTMHLKPIAVVATTLLVALTCWFALVDPARGADRDAPAQAPIGLASADRGQQRADAAPAAGTADQRQRAPAVTAANATDARAVSGRVVDLRGQPLRFVRVRRHGSIWPRWQGGDIGWISDGEQSRFVPPAELARLRADPALAADFFADLQRPEAWRAVLLDAAMPAAEVVTDDRGVFAFAVGVDAPELDLAEPELLLLAEARGDDGGTLLIAAPSIAAGGRVVDPTGRALPRAEFTARWNPNLAFVGMPSSVSIQRAWAPRTLRVDDQGHWFLAAVPAGLLGGEITATCTGYRSASVAMPTLATTTLDLVLPGAAEAAIGVDGRVVDATGQPIAGATVCLGDDSVRTDAAGRFAVPSLTEEARTSLTVFAAGFAPLHRADFVDDVRRDPRRGQGLELCLCEPARALRGVVLDGDGRPLADVRVNLFDPTLLDFSFTPVEGRLGAWERGVATDAAGRFELGGLANRTYRLRVWRPDDGLLFVSEPITAGSSDLVVQVPTTALHATVRGTVTSDGPLPKELAVAISYPIHVIQRGDGCMTDGTAPVPVGADGAFTLRAVPRRHAYIVLVAPGLGALATPVEAIAADGTLRLDCAARRTLQIVASGAADGGSASVLDDDDQPLPVEVHVGGARTRSYVLTAERGQFPPCTIPLGARTVLLQRSDGSWQRADIRDDAGGIARAVLRL